MKIMEMLNMDMKKTRPLNNADRQKDIKCKDCDKRCEGKTNLRRHMMDTHPKTYSCKVCENSFDARWKL